MAKSLSLVQKDDSFFNDAFFKDAWEDFDKAMQQVLNKFDDKGLTVSIFRFILFFKEKRDITYRLII